MDKKKWSTLSAGVESLIVEKENKMRKFELRLMIKEEIIKLKESQQKSVKRLKKIGFRTDRVHPAHSGNGDIYQVSRRKTGDLAMVDSDCDVNGKKPEDYIDNL